MRARTAVPLLSALVAAGLLAAAPPAFAAAPRPAVLAATGDSITRAFDVDGSHFLKDAPAESWATGTDTRVGSVLSRFGGGGHRLQRRSDRREDGRPRRPAPERRRAERRTP